MKIELLKNCSLLESNQKRHRLQKLRLKGEERTYETNKQDILRTNIII